jgi:hypothetical protein
MPALNAYVPALFLSKLIYRSFERSMDARPAHPREQHLQRVYLRGEVQLEVRLLLFGFAGVGLDLNLLDARLEDIAVQRGCSRLGAPGFTPVEGHIGADEPPQLVIRRDAAAHHLSRLTRLVLKNKRAIVVITRMRDFLQECRDRGLIDA